ncbi:hypothetical protein SAMN05216269_101491, partial [Flavobacterium xinjiangense]
GANYTTAQTGTTITNNGCTANQVLNLTVTAKPATPTISNVTHATCVTVNGSFTISNYNATYTYIINPSAGVNVSGSIVTAPEGTYTVISSTGLCSSLPSNDVVLSPAICANADEIAVGNGTKGMTNAGNVLGANPTNADLLNGTAVLIGNVNLTVTTAATPKTVGAPVPSIDVATGIVSVPTNTPAGTYSIVYQICEKLNPSNCSSATATVAVGAAAVNPVTETGTAPSTGGTVFGNIASNDTVNGVPATLGTTGNATVSESGTWPTGIALDSSTGAVTVSAGTAVGVYNVAYELCDKLTPQSCATVSDAITVTATVNPVTETGIAPSAGGTVFTNIVSNDKVNGVPATLGTTGNAAVSESGTWPTGITLDPLTGTVTVAAGTAVGTYNVTYELCDKLTPQSCATVSNAIAVTAAVNPVTETASAPSTGGTVFVNITSNDTT